MYVLFDSFNRKVVSRHRSIDAVAQSHAKMAKCIRKNNGPGSYLPMALRVEDGDDYRDPDNDEADYFVDCLQARS